VPDLDALDDLASELRAVGGTAETFVADASDPLKFKASMRQLAEQITPGVVIYNAAIVAPDNVLETDLKYLVTAYKVDAFGAISAARCSPRHARRRCRYVHRQRRLRLGEPLPGYATMPSARLGCGPRSRSCTRS
jgi:hypothetical protein